MSVAKSQTETEQVIPLFQQVRSTTESLCAPLELEDYGIQTMVDVSPPKWHLAHVTWFFEAFILKPYLTSYSEYHPLFSLLFNSYYETAGRFHPRPERGLLSRPTVRQVYDYRQYVNKAMLRLLDQYQHRDHAEILRRTILGCHHEQQHQELLMTDIKHILAYNPMRPVYHDITLPDTEPVALQWLEIKGGMVKIGHSGTGFCYDNELPQHDTYVADFKVANRPVSNKEYQRFIEEDGYQQVELWLSDGWKIKQQQEWQAPLYWEKHDNQWCCFGLAGLNSLDPDAPVCHVSYYEADAYARWANKRLLTEFEWEHAAAMNQGPGNFQEQAYLQPITGYQSANLQQMLGDVWEWTQSAYLPYVGFKALPGTLGEYNGKFMANQMVLRGGSCVTPENHIRISYRNFFYAKDRWQFSGIRLAC